jgi:hypothetical protein
MCHHFPSIMVNSAGDMVTGFSGNGATNFVRAYWHWRLADGTEAAVPLLIRASTDPAGTAAWGDYSATSLDPSDDHSIVTVQAFTKHVYESEPSAAAVVGRVKPRR